MLISHNKSTMALVFAVIIWSSPAIANPAATLNPVQSTGNEIIRYARGVPYVDIVGTNGVVRVTPRDMDRGSLRFEISVLNKSESQANFGSENIRIGFRGSGVSLLTYNDLMSRTDNRRGWRRFAAIMGGAFQAQGAGSMHSFSGTTHTPYGTAFTSGTITVPPSQAELNAINRQTAHTLESIDRDREAMRAMLANGTLQTSTVQPNEIHTGWIMLERVRLTQRPQNISITVNWNGEEYPFLFSARR